MSNFGKGITIASGFDLGAETPLDSRLVVETFQELQDHIDNNRAYDGMIVYVVEHKTTYQYRDGKIRVFGEGGSGGGDGFVHIGSDLPPSEEYLWIDTSPKDDEISLNYIEMLDSTTEKLSNLNTKMTIIEENIGKITSDENQDKIRTFRTTLSTIKNEINVLFLQINNLKGQPLTTLKNEAKKTRKTAKKLIYSLIDFNDEVMRVLDSELIFDYSGEGGGGNNGDNNDDIVVNNASILTEDGVALLTEDGLLILADGIEEVVVPNNAITDESGKLLLTESGLMLLADEIEKSEVLADAILTELGYDLMTENGKQILKG